MPYIILYNLSKKANITHFRENLFHITRIEVAYRNVQELYVKE